MIACARTVRRTVRPSALTALAGVVTAGLVLGACAADGPRLLRANESGIAIALEGGGDEALAAAVDIAKQHCTNVRRLPVLDRVTEVGDDRVAFFDCVPV